ncbi:MAG: GMC family oxidoreductase N-terminal domain-containing protein [Ectothiorhodospiraceae bacterium]|nr:GMC family oxidoreductase N-terminal domain-containing protein [Chromatiales bacterium]MCP5154232.1 GMC family oxidoreductase N-terminal domain-containing protein [Ectothiorhodospiraceae bacterium]
MAADEFDYVVVGAGSAGCIVAARLSEDREATVCLLEAGPPDRSPYLHVPGGFIKNKDDPNVTWRFSSEPGPGTAGRRISTPQGRTLGGSSAINGLVYNRGQPMDYDAWAQRGNRGWSHAEVTPYFRRCEGRVGPGDDRVRGRDGPLRVTDIDWRHPLCDAFVAGVEGLGIPRNPDHNAGDQAGVGYYQRTIHRARRVSSAVAFLHPARARGQPIEVRTHAHATAVVLDGRRAVGVRYRHGGPGGSARVVRARREVILCGGTVNSARLLQLSGIGPAPRLRALGIEVVQDLPGVGENFHDHYAIRMVARARGVTTINDLARGPRLAREVAAWALRRPSILGLSPSLAHVFWKSDDALDLPDLQFTFTPASYKEGVVGRLDDFPGMTCGVWQHRPESRGHVRLRSADPFEHPEIQPNYLATETDRRVLVAGIRLARRFLGTPELAPYFAGEVVPGPDARSDDELLDFAFRRGSTVFHLVGTCRMGPDGDPMAVVDPELRVRGIERLRVVDASVMPALTSGNTNAPTMMIAEKAADMIRGRPPLPPLETP